MHAGQRVHAHSWSLPVHARQELELSFMRDTQMASCTCHQESPEHHTLITMLTYSQQHSQLGSAGEGGAGAELCEGC